MTYSVTVENGAANHYTATVIGWPTCLAERATREEAITRVKRRFSERLKQVEIVPIEVASTLAPAIERSDEHPWARFADMYEDNPLLDEVLDAIKVYRHTTVGNADQQAALETELTDWAERLHQRKQPLCAPYPLRPLCLRVDPTLLFSLSLAHFRA